VKLALLFFALAISSSARAPQTRSKPEDLAKQSAATWLALIDAGKYASSWQDAAKTFKAHVTKKQWENALRASRSPLGALQSRKLQGATYKTSLPGAPDGQYVVLQYESSFEHKQSAIETVTPMLEADGTWRVSGYFIK
jgi:hypothetical protein